MISKPLCALITFVLFSTAAMPQQLELFKVKPTVSGQGYRYGLRNTVNSKVIIPANYGSLYFIADSTLLQAEQDGSFGVFDTLGQIIIPFEYQTIISFNGELFKVKKNNKFGLINRNNQVLTPFEYDWIMYENEPLRIGRKNGLLGVFNDKNETIIPFTYETIEKRGDYFIIMKKGGFGLIDKDGSLLLQANHTNIRPVFNGYFVVENRDNFAIYQPTQIQPTFKYNYVGKEYKGIVCAAIGQQYGLVDSNLNAVVPFHFKNPISERSSIFKVDSAEYFGYFNRQGKRLSKIEYLSEPRFYHGWFLLESRKLMALIDISGEHQQKFEYKVIYVIDREKAAVKEAENQWSIR